MKEFILTQPYNSLEEMLCSGEVAVYKEELEQGNIEKYAIVSRIGNRYDLNGDRVVEFAPNPFYKTQEDIPVSYCTITDSDVIEEVDATIEKILEENNMKYIDIEALIDKEVEKAVAEARSNYEQEIASLKLAHEIELSKVREEVKSQIIAIING